MSEDLISRKDALRAIEKHTAKDTMGFLNFERKAVFEWTKYDIYKIINDLPSANLQPTCNQLATNLQPTCNQLATDCVSRQAVLDAIDDIESEVADGDGFQYAKWRQYFCELPSADIDLSDYSDRLWRNAYERGKADAEPRWNNHEVACIIADLMGDACACNCNGIDEWLPRFCEFANNECPYPVDVACWEQYLKWKGEADV